MTKTNDDIALSNLIKMSNTSEPISVLWHAKINIISN